MSSPVPDDYVGLISPWKPMASFAMKNVTSIHDRIEISRDSKVSNLDGGVVETDSLGATIGIDDHVQHMDVGFPKTDNINNNITVVDDGAQVSTNSGPHEMVDVFADDLQKDDSAIEGSRTGDMDSTDVDGDIGDGAQVDKAGFTDTDNDEPQHIDTKCVAVSTCVANSGDHRKVVSHIFGRNKGCTRELPYNLWIFWCRKHYQRFKYRAEDAENWHTIQLGLVRNQLETFEDWGEVRSWTITLRKAEQEALAKENKNGTTYTDNVSSCWERFLVPYLGPNKSFAQVRQVLNEIERKFNEAEYRNRDKKLKTFPGVEFLPHVQKTKEVKKPAAKKGEVGYKKITLDQPAFNRKTRANTQFIKEKAAKKVEASNTPKSSRSASKKEKSPDTDNDSDTSAIKKRKVSVLDNPSGDTAHRKRKSLDISIVEPDSKALPTKRMSMPPTTEAPPTFKPKALPAKRRRLTRGYEKHGSEGEDTMVVEKENEE